MLLLPIYSKGMGQETLRKEEEAICKTEEVATAAAAATTAATATATATARAEAVAAAATARAVVAVVAAAAATATARVDKTGQTLAWTWGKWQVKIFLL